MKNEKAFILDKSCKLSKNCMAAQKERNKFHQLAKNFAEKHFAAKEMTYKMHSTLICDKEIPGQVCKNKTDGLFRYKKNSDTQKAWEAEVTSQIDFSPLKETSFWYWGLITVGAYNLWSYKDIVYGYLYDKQKEPKLPDGATEIKMSDYYKIIEELEAEQEEKRKDDKNE